MGKSTWNRPLGKSVIYIGGVGFRGEGGGDGGTGAYHSGH